MQGIQSTVHLNVSMSAGDRAHSNRPAPLGGGILVGDQGGVISGEGLGGGVASQADRYGSMMARQSTKCHDADGHEDTLLAEGLAQDAAEEKTHCRRHLTERRSAPR